MKKLLLTTALVMGLSGMALAEGNDRALMFLTPGDLTTVTDATESGDYCYRYDADTVNIAKYDCTDLSLGDDLTVGGDLSGDGGDQMVGFLQNQVAASTTALTAAQCGSSVVSAGAAVQPLPEASTVLGCRYTMVCGTADDFDIDPADASDAFGVINYVSGGTGTAITPSAGDEIRCTDIGSSITIEAVGANLWAAVGVGNGAWTDVN